MNLRRPAMVFYLALLSCVFVVNTTQQATPQYYAVGHAEFVENSHLLRTLKATSEVVVYEGLPHKMHEHKTLKEELDSKPTQRIQGFPFYQGSTVVSSEDTDKLKSLFNSDKTFRPWLGEKGCGGFHPDYCLEWTGTNGFRYCCFFCFGCGEIKINQDNQVLRCDISDDSERQLWRILYGYRKYRPMTQHLQQRVSWGYEE